MGLGMSVIPTFQHGCIGIMFNEIVQIVLAMGEHIDLETIGMIDRAYGWVIVDWLHFGQRIWCSCRWLTWKCPQKSRFQRKHPHKSSYIALIIFGGMLPSLQVVRVACMKLWAIRNILWSLHSHCNLDDLGAGKHRRLHLCKAQKKTDKRLLMLKTNLFLIVLGRLPNWDAFASTYLDDTYIGPTSSSNMIPNAQWYVHLCHHPKRSFERDFFKKLSNGIWRYFGRASSWSLQCPFLLGWQCRPLRLSVALSEESHWFRVLFSKSICAINQMTQKNDYWWLIVALDTVMCFYSFYNSYKLFMQESVKSYSAVFLVKCQSHTGSWQHSQGDPPRTAPTTAGGQSSLDSGGRKLEAGFQSSPRFEFWTCLPYWFAICWSFGGIVPTGLSFP